MERFYICVYVCVNRSDVYKAKNLKQPNLEERSQKHLILVGTYINVLNRSIHNSVRLHLPQIQK